VLDYLAIGLSEMANISERRIERLVNPSLSELPAFLVAQGGLHSGFMIAHCTAAALASENKVTPRPDMHGRSLAFCYTLSLSRSLTSTRALTLIASVKHSLTFPLGFTSLRTRF
jgi:histidine ammonia-lyase